MGKKQKKKGNKKGRPSVPKQKSHHIDPIERTRVRKEIEEILLAAENEKERKEQTGLRRSKVGFSTEEILAFISDLKFKDPEENKKVPPTPPTFNHKTKTWTVEEKPTYYERWYRLVTEKEIEIKEQNSGVSIIKELIKNMLSFTNNMGM